MPRTFALKAKLQFTHALDIDAAVGKNCPNRADDVRLVQFLLAVWQAHEKDTAKLLKTLNGTKPISVDGVCGPNTLANIKAFEEFHKPAVNSDGRIDPLFSSPQSNKMFLLNTILFFAGGLSGGVPATRVPFPPSLIPHLYR